MSQSSIRKEDKNVFSDRRWNLWNPMSPDPMKSNLFLPENKCKPVTQLLTILPMYPYFRTVRRTISTNATASQLQFLPAGAFSSAKIPTHRFDHRLLRQATSATYLVRVKK